jgi:hypothetical protein
MRVTPEYRLPDAYKLPVTPSGPLLLESQPMPLASSWFCKRAGQPVDAAEGNARLLLTITWSFYAGGQQKMVLASNGYLGIGTGPWRYRTGRRAARCRRQPPTAYIKVESEAASAAGIYFENTVCQMAMAGQGCW